jgi:hypothetical protein
MDPILVLIHCTVLIGLNPFSRVKDLKYFIFGIDGIPAFVSGRIISLFCCSVN